MTLVDEGDEMMQEKQGANGQQWRVAWFELERALVYDRFLLPSKFLKLVGLNFISANSMECS